MWPTQAMEPLVTITPLSVESGIHNLMYNGANIGANGMASGAWPSSNLAILIPFSLSKKILVNALFWVNGATASGNVDAGIYDANGTRLLSTGSTAQSGTSAIQVISTSATEIGPGLFYLALAMDNTTGTIVRTLSGQSLRNKMAGMAQAATSFVLPATLTFASVGQDYIPMVGLSTRSSI